ncbi:MAG: 50S ribosomal protein L27 [Candidatus Peribacteria bacterium]|nr:50S ribosomal protein L27 [Candidatus Peribacteria bacterium]
MAHKKAAGSAKNLRDSQPKYRGVKLFGGQKALAGNIIIRQKGSQYVAGQHTYLGADFTIHATIDGMVSFKKKNFKKFDGRTYLKTVVEVIPTPTIAPMKKSEKAEPAPLAEKKVTEKGEQALKAETTEIPIEQAEAPIKKLVTKKTPAKKERTEKAPKAEKKSPAKKPTKKE